MQSINMEYTAQQLRAQADAIRDGMMLKVKLTKADKDELRWANTLDEQADLQEEMQANNARKAVSANS